MKKIILALLLSIASLSCFAQQRVTPATRITVFSFSEVRVTDEGVIRVCVYPAVTARRNGVVCGPNSRDTVDRSTVLHDVKRKGYVMSAVDVDTTDTGYTVTVFWDPEPVAKQKK